ncbi:ribosome maturation factor RimP [Williamsia sp.]|uniref:ribosome maturation factor RimP n=1 Tax=Williamsia sp. TaxID=1872085 RepID=UPI001A3300F6|nr:ribosome maturation factor RimP [Williamsia sp.]MBJ7287401.1 ribosome maturation factor RimP [Williamsia sp.]
MSGDTEAITVLISPVVHAQGFDLEEVIVHRSGDRSVVRILVDRDNGAELDVLADLSREISAVVDDAPKPILGALAYTLEVTSPGVDRPLTAPRHWRRAHGRKVIVQIASGGAADSPTEKVAGRIGRLNDDETVVDLVITHGGRSDVRRVDLTDVASAVVQVDFGGPSADERELCGLLEKNVRGNT